MSITETLRSLLHLLVDHCIETYKGDKMIEDRDGACAIITLRFHVEDIEPGTSVFEVNKKLLYMVRDCIRGEIDRDPALQIVDINMQTVLDSEESEQHAAPKSLELTKREILAALPRNDLLRMQEEVQTAINNSEPEDIREFN